MLKVFFGSSPVEKLQRRETHLVSRSQLRALELFEAPVGPLVKERPLNFERDVSLTSFGVRLVALSALLVCLSYYRLSVQLLLELIAYCRDPGRIPA